MRAGPVRRGGEEGVTLLEVVMAVAIMAVAFAVVVGGVGAAVVGSDLQRRQARADLALRSAAETIVYDPCASTYPATSPPGLSVVVKRVSYWDPASNAYTTTLPADCALDGPLQLLDLEVTSTSGRLVSGRLQVAKRP